MKEEKNKYRESLAYMVDVMDDYDGYDAKSLKILIDKMVKFAKRKLMEKDSDEIFTFRNGPNLSIYRKLQGTPFGEKEENMSTFLKKDD